MTDWSPTRPRARAALRRTPPSASPSRLTRSGNGPGAPPVPDAVGGGRPHLGDRILEQPGQFRLGVGRLNLAQRPRRGGPDHGFGVGGPGPDHVGHLGFAQFTHQVHRGGADVLVVVAQPVQGGRDRIAQAQVPHHVESALPDRRILVAQGCVDEVGREIPASRVLDGVQHCAPHRGRPVLQVLRQQLASPRQAELRQRVDRLPAGRARLDLADDPIGDAEPFERHGGTDADFRIGVVQGQHQGPFGDRSDLFQGLDAPHADPPGGVAQGPDQGVDDLGLVELPQGAGDAGPDEGAGSVSRWSSR